MHPKNVNFQYYLPQVTLPNHQILDQIGILVDDSDFPPHPRRTSQLCHNHSHRRGGFPTGGGRFSMWNEDGVSGTTLPISSREWKIVSLGLSNSPPSKRGLVGYPVGWGGGGGLDSLRSCEYSHWPIHRWCSLKAVTCHHCPHTVFMKRICGVCSWRVVARMRRVPNFNRDDASKM